MIRFSIITPSFNQGRFLPDCVESVLSQLDENKEWRSMSADADELPAGGDSSHASVLPATKGDHASPLLAGRSCISPPCFEIEHIVVDAGSTDETPGVLKRHPHLKWTSEPDKGMSDGINKGFLRSTGDWVMWLNCDDYLLPGALAEVAECAKKHPESAVIHGDCIFVSEDKIPIRRKYDTAVDEWDFLFVGCCIPSTATFYRSDIIRSGHLLDVTYRNCMDWEYFLRLTRLGYRFQYLPEALAGFRWHDDSTTQKYFQRMIDEGLRCQREHIEERGLPKALKNTIALKTLRKVFQARRVLKRLAVHGRVW